MAPPEAKQQEEAEDEPPLEMDISFDDSTDGIQTEDNVSLEDEYDDSDDSETYEDTESAETEEVSLDNFGSSFEATEVTAKNNDAEISTEEVDLMDFGIDTNAEETPITQDVEEAKKKDAVVDYDLTVGDENTSAAPVVSEIKNEKPAEKTDTEAAVSVPADSTVVENSLLQQIVSDLSGL